LYCRGGHRRPRSPRDTRGHIAYGSPPELKPLTSEQCDDICWYCEEYLQLADRYRQAEAPLNCSEERRSQ
jgi:hypothetical protein